MDARVIVITIMQKFGEKSVYFGWFMAISKGGLNQPPPHSSYIQKPRTIRVKISIWPILGAKLCEYFISLFLLREGFQKKVIFITF